MHYLGPRAAPPCTDLAGRADHARALRGPHTGKFSLFTKSIWRQENFRPGNSRYSLGQAGAKRICAAESIFERFAVSFASGFYRLRENFARIFLLILFGPGAEAGKERILVSEILLEPGSIIKKRDFRRRPEIFAAAQRFPPPPRDFHRPEIFAAAAQRIFMRRVLISHGKTAILIRGNNITGGSYAIS